MHRAFQVGDLGAAESQMPQPQGKAATFSLPQESSPAEQGVGHFPPAAFHPGSVSSSSRIRDLGQQEWQQP